MEHGTTPRGTELWDRGKQLIPGGSMLLSKRSEMHLPTGWPAYFSRTSGCSIWDLDDTQYLDFYLMGVGTNILGYSHPAVDAAVRSVIDKGNLSTLNAPEEVLLAERLIELHPWADMVRYARSGGEICAVAVRIARAASGKDKVAFCGYHGWHDWYLAANLSEDDSLDGHLLPGLEPNGVPRTLRGSALTFTHNDLDGLSVLLADNPDVGVIFMEVQRNSPPAPGFLEGVRALATAHGAVLVFDECTSGFRKSLGGIHLDYGVEPDLATFGKTLGNGYAITAVIGRAEVMHAAQSSFISSTFWTERIGPTAALAALEVMAAEDAPAQVHQLGQAIQAGWRQLGEAVGLDIEPSGLPALATFTVRDRDALQVKTYITTRMLDFGFLAGTACYSTIAHTADLRERYFDALQTVFAELARMDDAEIAARLPHGVVQSGFKRLN